MDELARWDGFFGEEFCKCGIPIADLRRFIVDYAYAPFVWNGSDGMMSKYSLADMFDRSEFTLSYRFWDPMDTMNFCIIIGLIQITSNTDNVKTIHNPKMYIWTNGDHQLSEFGLGQGRHKLSERVPQEGTITMRLKTGRRVQWQIGNKPTISSNYAFIRQDLSNTFVFASAQAADITIL